jgi:hypothetical protein
VKQIRKRLTYANVMSTIAVFLVVGGASAFAASQLGKNTVGSKQLKKNAVTAAKVKKEAITAAKIKNGAVNAAKLAAGAVGTTQLDKAAVTGEKLAANAVTGEKLADNSVTSTKIANNAVIGTKIADNAVTSTKIAAGSVTASKLGPITVQTETATVATGGNGSVNVDCPAGQRAISGGGSWDVFEANLFFLATRPIRSSADVGQMADGEVPGGWRASGRNTTGAPVNILVWVLCIE